MRYDGWIMTDIRVRGTLRRARSFTLRRRLLRVGLVVLPGWPAITRAAPDAAESARIERLLAHLASVDGVRFVRNGKAYPGAEAAVHLRNKLDAVRDRLSTVQQFIDEVASTSSTSGRPYLVRLRDGSELSARDWLRGELQRLEGGAAR